MRFVLWFLPLAFLMVFWGTFSTSAEDKSTSPLGNRRIVLFEVESAKKVNERELTPGVAMRTYEARVVVKNSLPPGLENKGFSFDYNRPEQAKSGDFVLMGLHQFGGYLWLVPKQGARCLVIIDDKGEFQPAKMRRLASHPTGWPVGSPTWPPPKDWKPEGPDGVTPAWAECKLFYDGVTNPAGPEKGLATILDQRKPVGSTFFTLIRDCVPQVNDTQDFCKSVSAWLVDPKITLSQRAFIAQAFLFGVQEGLDAKTALRSRDAEKLLLDGYIGLLREVSQQKDWTVNPYNVRSVLTGLNSQFLDRNRNIGCPPPALDEATRKLLFDVASAFKDKAAGANEILKWVKESEQR